MSFIEMIEPVIDHSLTIAHRRASVGDVAHGLIAALKRVRSAIEEVGGYTMVSLLDGAIRDRLIIRGLRAARAGEREQPAALPVPGPRAVETETIMIAAAETCVIYGADAPDITGLLHTAFMLVDRLIEALHAAPTCEDLLACLQADDARDESVFADEAAAEHASVH
ncbi:hypothetical protein GCM10011611_36480 [Aliidongia dinghuensis]|uniref:Uncharacterized protein n=1 Tax=Aliidongia dinghuensis TaxID=1867774 RepID=A0A8J2YVH7_9PROT|nr:hypothetical protein [Aliidongia dinghuensis]GGF27128.1 hypothetical protein GCM10011611_36480 [Aliidongia dinghuensis]